MASPDGWNAEIAPGDSLDKYLEPASCLHLYTMTNDILPKDTVRNSTGASDVTEIHSARGRYAVADL
jgi:hypothetical protein